MSSNIQYFSLKPYLKKWPKLLLYFFVGRKGIGKTYNGVNHCINDYETTGRGFAWLFNTKDEAKAFLPELKSYLDPEKYFVKGAYIYDKEKDIIMGVIGGVNTPNMFKNNQIIRNLVFDEITSNSPMSYSKMYDNFIIIVSNMERTKRDFKAFMFMNAFTQDNLFFQKWGIVKGEENVVVKGRIGVFFLDPQQYLGNKDDFTLAKELASYSPKMYEMAYENKFSFDDNSFINSQLESVIYDLRVVYGGETFLVGKDINYNITFDYDNRKINVNRTIAIENMDALFTRKYNDKENLNDIIELWVSKIMKGKVFFRDFYVREQILELVDSVSEHREIGGS